MLPKSGAAQFRTAGEEHFLRKIIHSLLYLFPTACQERIPAYFRTFSDFSGETRPEKTPFPHAAYPSFFMNVSVATPCGRLNRSRQTGSVPSAETAFTRP